MTGNLGFPAVDRVTGKRWPWEIVQPDILPIDLAWSWLPELSREENLSVGGTESQIHEAAANTQVYREWQGHQSLMACACLKWFIASERQHIPSIGDWIGTGW